MTLIVAIKCSDGIVVGADGAASFSSILGQPTITQPVKKLAIIGNSAVLGVAGPVGHSQRIQVMIQEMMKDSVFSPKSGTVMPPAQAMTLVRQKIWPLLKEELSIAAEAAKTVGQLAMQGALCSVMLAVPVSKQPCLFNFDYQGSPCEATIDMPFFSAGSGQQVADPFLAFIRRHLWLNKLPTVADATFAAYWSLDYAIKGAPNVGIGEPKQIVVLSNNGKFLEAVELTAAELVDHQASMDTAHSALRSFRDGLATSSTETTTTTTPPPSPPTTAA